MECLDLTNQSQKNAAKAPPLSTPPSPPPFPLLPPHPLNHSPPHRIPRAHKHSEDQHRPRHINARPHARQPFSRVVDVDQIVHDPGGDVRPAQRIQIARVQAGRVARDDAGGEDAEVLEAVLLRSFGADDGLGGAISPPFFFSIIARTCSCSSGPLKQPTIHYSGAHTQKENNKKVNNE